MPDDNTTFPMFERVNRWLKPKPEPTPEPNQVGWLTGQTLGRLKAWKTLQNVPLEQLGSFVILIPAVVFLAISGFVAWVALLVAFGFRMISNTLFGWTNRGRK
jgi:hypothetical protein